MTDMNVNKRNIILILWREKSFFYQIRPNRKSAKWVSQKSGKIASVFIFISYDDIRDSFVYYFMVILNFGSDDYYIQVGNEENEVEEKHAKRCRVMWGNCIWIFYFLI